MNELIPVNLLHISGQAIQAVFELIVADNYDSVGLRLSWIGREVSAVESHYFSALCAIRVRIAEYGLTPMCYGSCRNLVVSGMAISMGMGLKGYLVELGKPSTTAQLVPIFDSGPDMDLVSVAEQLAFKEQWMSQFQQRT